MCIWGIPSIILLEIGNAFLLKYAPALRIYLTININCLLTMIPFTFDADNNIILIPQLFLVWKIVYYFNDAGYIIILIVASSKQLFMCRGVATSGVNVACFIWSNIGEE